MTSRSLFLRRTSHSPSQVKHEYNWKHNWKFDPEHEILKLFLGMSYKICFSPYKTHS